ncbi:MAG: hypothetical protein PHG06_18370 [Parabacteroides sp.]|nr:hypothetical protein [Parabacteroides sp.]
MLILVTTLTLIFPVFGIVFIGLGVKYDKKRWILYAFLLAFVLGIIGFSFTPYQGQNTDLVRHFDRMILASNHGMEYSEIFENLPFFYWILKLFSYCSNPHCLPFFSTFVEYAILFFVILKTNAHVEEDKRFTWSGIIAIICLTSFLGYCSGIFQYLTFTLFVLLVYLDVNAQSKLQRWLVILGYAMLMLLHSSGVILFILRLLFFFINSRKGRINTPLVILLMCWSTLTTVIIKILSSFTNLFGVSYFIKTVEQYMENGSSVYRIQTFLRTIALIVCIYIILQVKKYINVKQIDGKWTMYSNFALIVALFTIGSFFQSDLYTRFTMLVMMLTAPLLGMFNRSLKGKTSSLILLCEYMFFGVNLLYYTLTAYRLFMYNDLLFTNIFTILKGIFL